LGKADQAVGKLIGCRYTHALILAISRMVRFCLRLNKRFTINAAMAQKKKNRKSLPIIPHSPKNIAFNQGRPSEASCTKQK